MSEQRFTPPAGEQNLSRSAELAAELRAPDAIDDPRPAVYAEAADLLRGYFEAKSRETGGETDHSFTEALDSVVSALGGFYARDEHTGRITTGGTIGERPGDDSLEEALRAAHQAQQQAERHGHVRVTTSSGATEGMLTEMGSFRHQEIIEDSWRSLRHRAADLLRDATRSADQDPTAYPYLAQTGMHVTDAIGALSGIAAVHELDNKAPLYRDYLARHIATALALSER